MGFRFPVTDLEILEAPLLYLHSRYVRNNRRAWSKIARSQQAACDDLFEWFSFLEIAKLHWADVETNDIRGYRTILENSVSPRTRQPYKANTVRRRLGTILAFHRWTASEGYAAGGIPPKGAGRGSPSLDGNALAHLSRPPGCFEASNLLPSQEPSQPNPFLQVSQLQSILLALGPHPSGRTRDQRPSRDRLAATFALVTGARISETLGVILSDILAVQRPPHHQPAASGLMLLRHTKGSRPRQIIVPMWLLDELLHYAETERTVAVGRALAAGHGPAANLFLNGADASDRDVGRALTARNLSRAFRSATISSGLFERIRDETNSGLPDKLVAAHSFHDLRHTFAVLQYMARKARGDMEPWKTIATLLGHRSFKTTMDYYLPSVSLAEAEVSDVMSGFIRSLYSLE